MDRSASPRKVRSRVIHSFPRNGHYVIRVRASGDQAGPEPVKMAVRIDGKDLKQFDVTAPSGKFQDFQLKQNLRGGPRRLAVAFLNDYYKPDAPDPKQRDRNLIVESIEVEGPLYSPGDPLPESHRRIIFRTPKTQGRRSRGGPGDPRKVRQPCLPPAGHRKRAGEAGEARRPGDRRMATGSTAASNWPSRPSWYLPSSSSASSSTRGEEGRRPRRAPSRRPVDRRLRAGEPDVVFPLEQHARRRALASDGRRVAPVAGRARQTGAPHAPRPQGAGRWSTTSPASGFSFAT